MHAFDSISDVPFHQCCAFSLIFCLNFSDKRQSHSFVFIEAVMCFLCLLLFFCAVVVVVMVLNSKSLVFQLLRQSEECARLTVFCYSGATGLLLFRQLDV